MKRVKSFDEFVNENLKAAIGSPIKYTKIKNNLKKYQQTKVQKALNDVDFEKKKQKSKGDLDAKTKATLQAANKAKNQALADTGAVPGGARVAYEYTPGPRLTRFRVRVSKNATAPDSPERTH